MCPVTVHGWVRGRKGLDLATPVVDALRQRPKGGSDLCSRRDAGEFKQDFCMAFGLFANNKMGLRQWDALPLILVCCEWHVGVSNK